jgi:uncharacterized protein
MATVYGPITLVVIQPTPYCNLDCDYCYLPDRGDRSRLDVELVDTILERVLESPYVGGDFTVLWHAGEPLAVPIAFYDEATRRLRAAEQRFNEQQGRPLQILQNIQTNATLIDQKWCDCLLRNGISVGVSLDGPAFLHDAHRRTRTGLGTHAATMRGIAQLQRNDIPFSVIAVLTEDSLEHADAIFAFFLDNGISEVGFNMEEKEGSNRHSSLDGQGSEQRYRAFLERFWDLTVGSGGALRLREFEVTCGLAYSETRLERTDLNHPFVIVNVDHRGDFSTFDPELLAVATVEYGDFVLGNVRDDSLESVVSSEKFQRIQRDMGAGIELCRSSCDYFRLCGGGAGSNKYWEHGTFACAETQACRYRIKLVADVVLAGLESSLGLAG